MAVGTWARKRGGGVSAQSCLPKRLAFLPQLRIATVPSRIRSNSMKTKRSFFPNRYTSGGSPAGFLRGILLVALAAAMLGATAAQARPGGAKTLTVERIYSAPSLSGYLTDGIEWSPDSKRISYFGQGRSGVEIWTTDAATGERKVLVKANVLAAAMPPEKTSAIQSTGLGRVQAENYQWSPTGDALLFIGGSSLVVLDLKTMAPKPLVTGADDIEDPKFSP